MTALLAFIPGPIKTTLIWALAAFVLVSGSYLYGKRVGTQQAAVSALETSVKVLRKRNEIDETVSTADASALCSEYGLSVDDQAECVRRIRETNSQP